MSKRETDQINSMSAEDLSAFFSSIQFPMLTTSDRDGHLHSRPVQMLRFDADHVFWFFTSAHSAKIHQLAGNANFNLAFADAPGKLFVSVSGVAETLRDEQLARSLWQVGQTIFFPLGPADPDLVILRAQAFVAHYWNGNSSLFETVVKFGNAVLRGARADLGTAAEIPLQPGTTVAAKDESDDDQER